MKTKHSVYAAVLFTFVLGIKHSVQAKIFINPHGYQITTPNSWVAKVGPHDDKYAAIFYCATGRNGLPALPIVEVATRPQEAMTMKKLVLLGPWMMNGVFRGFHQTSATHTQLNGVSALDIRGTYPRAGRTIYVRELFAVRAGEAYMITTAYPDGQQSSYEPSIQSVLQSVQWR